MKEKLVRDKIPEIIKKNGETPRIRIAQRHEILRFLQDKLLEEANEVSREYLIDKIPEELADCLEVIHEFQKRLGISLKRIEKIRKKKRRNRGGFTKNIILEMKKTKN